MKFAFNRLPYQRPRMNKIDGLCLYFLAATKAEDEARAFYMKRFWEQIPVSTENLKGKRRS